MSSSGLPAKVVDSVTSPVESAPSFSVKAGEKAEVVHAVKVASATVTADQSAKLETTIEKSTKSDMTRVQESTTLTKKPVEVSTPVQKEVAQAEQKAVDNIIKDIKRYDPQEAKLVAQNDYKSTDDVNKFSVDQVRQNAPEVATKVEEVGPPEDPHRRAWALSAGLLISTADPNSGMCGGNNSGMGSPPGACQNFVNLGFQTGITKNFSLGKNFRFKTGTWITMRNASVTQSNNAYLINQVDLDIPLLIAYDFNRSFHIHIGPNIAMLLTSSASCPPNGNGCYSNSGNVSGFPEIAIGTSFENWNGELALQPANNLPGGNQPGLNIQSLILRTDIFIF